MRPVFRKIASVAELIEHLRPVRFPDGTYLYAIELIALKSDVRHNCDLLLAYVHGQLYNEALSPHQRIVLEQLRRDIYECKAECGKVPVNFLRPRHRRIVGRLYTAYDEMRLAAILVCQLREQPLMDSLGVSL